MIWNPSKVEGLETDQLRGNYPLRINEKEEIFMASFWFTEN